MHIYFREKKTGRFITHFIIPDETWDLLEKGAEEETLSVEDFILETLLRSTSHPRDTGEDYQIRTE